MTEGSIPYNKVGSDAPRDLEEFAQREGMTEEEWRARNLPTSKLVFRWRYSNRTIHLYERRLRSLAAFNVGPAVQAWVRSRLEWVRDNRFYDMPNGIIVLSIDPKGDVDIEQEPYREAPAFAERDNGLGTLWLARGDAVYTAGPIRHAADTLVRDLCKTLGYELAESHIDGGDAELFAVSDEFGIVSSQDTPGALVQKLSECFDKLWTLDR